MYPSEFICEGIKDIPLQKWQTQRKLAMSLGVSKTMVHRWIFFEACTHGGEQGSPVGNGIGFTGPSGSNEVP